MASWAQACACRSSRKLAQVLGFVRKKILGMEEPPCVIAVDCPSGIDCDSGEAAAECIPPR